MSRAMRLAVALFALILGGCLTNALNETPAKFDRRAPDEIRIEITGDSFDPAITHLGPEISFREEINLFDYTDYAYRMRGIVDKKTGLTLHQLYIDIRYPADWRWYESAYLIGGESLEVRGISNNVGGCGHYACTLEETIGISIPPEALNQDGLNVKISARSGHEDILRIPGSYMTAYLSSFPQASF